MSPLSVAYDPLFRHLNACPVCTSTPTMCTVAIRLVAACRLVERTLRQPIPPIGVVS